MHASTPLRICIIHLFTSPTPISPLRNSSTITTSSSSYSSSRHPSTPFGCLCHPQNLNKALLSGCSAGGLATIIHRDEFRGLFPRTTKVECLSDVGLFLDAADVSGGHTIRDFFSGVVNLQGVQKNLPHTCTNHLDPTSVEAAYDMLLMQSLTQLRAGKVVDRSVRYADVKSVKSPAKGSMPQWLQSTIKNSPVSIESPSISDLGLQAGVYGALMGLTYINGVSAPSAAYAGADVPGLILAGSFGASLYFMTKKNVKLGKEVPHAYCALYYHYCNATEFCFM